MKKTRALALFSGGLDSLLAIKTMTIQNIDVIALHFDMGFAGVSEQKEELEELVSQVEAKLHIVDIRDGFVKEILFNPKYGYGKNFNPCIDCHANMIRVAISLMESLKASFLISGEILGQRPMSQRAEALKQVETLSDVDGLLLRPMCAKLLPITVAEESGWVDRDKLFAISGRSRTKQMELAKDWGITKYPSPAGGCMLTDPSFGNKMKEFIKFDKFETRDIDVMKVGRHLRLPNGAKLVIGRNELENEKLSAIENSKFKIITLNNLIGPISLISSDAKDDDIELGLNLVCTYAKSSFGEKYSLMIEKKEYFATPFKSKQEAQVYFIN
jgi:tRNA-specific 2-thiouridylase